MLTLKLVYYALASIILPFKLLFKLVNAICSLRQKIRQRCTTAQSKTASSACPASQAAPAASSSSASISPSQPPVRVAVVGGGIAGCSAAWSLTKAGYQVEIFERRHTLGGNAKVVDWEITTHDKELYEAKGTASASTSTSASSANASSSTSSASSSINGPTRLVRTGLSVLAWPRAFFRNYRRLLTELGLTGQAVSLPFIIQNAEGRHWMHDQRNSSLWKQHGADIATWNRIVSDVTVVNDWMHGTSNRLTLYASNVLNPFNYIPVKVLLWWYGVSPSFWQNIFVPVYSSSFLTADLAWLPSVILPAIDHIIPLARPPYLDTWDENSSVVFAKMTERVHKVHTGVEILSIETKRKGAKHPVLVIFGPAGPSPASSSASSSASALASDAQNGSDATPSSSFSDPTSIAVAHTASRLTQERTAALAHARNATGLDPAIDSAREKHAQMNALNLPFDKIVFACPSDAVLKLVKDPSLGQKMLLNKFNWTDEDEDKTFTQGIIHSDTRVIPEDIRHIAVEQYSNYIEVTNLHLSNASSVSSSSSTGAAAVAESSRRWCGRGPRAKLEQLLTCLIESVAIGLIYLLVLALGAILPKPHAKCSSLAVVKLIGVLSTICILAVQLVIKTVGYALCLTGRVCLCCLRGTGLAGVFVTLVHKLPLRSLGCFGAATTCPFASPSAAAASSTTAGCGTDGTSRAALLAKSKTLPASSSASFSSSSASSFSSSAPAATPPTPTASKRKERGFCSLLAALPLQLQNVLCTLGYFLLPVLVLARPFFRAIKKGCKPLVARMVSNGKSSSSSSYSSSSAPAAPCSFSFSNLAAFFTKRKYSLSSMSQRTKKKVEDVLGGPVNISIGISLTPQVRIFDDFVLFLGSLYFFISLGFFLDFGVMLSFPFSPSLPFCTCSQPQTHAYENTFIVSSWIPEVKAAYASLQQQQQQQKAGQQKDADKSPLAHRPMLITYNLQVRFNCTIQLYDSII